MAEPFATVSSSSENQQRSDHKPVSVLNQQRKLEAEESARELAIKLFPPFKQLIKKCWQPVVIVILALCLVCVLLFRDCSTEVTRFREENDRLKAKNHILEQNNDQYYSDNARLRRENGEIWDKNTQQKEQIERLREKVTELERCNSELQGQVEKCKKLEYDYYRLGIAFRQCTKELNAEGTLFGIRLNAFGYNLGKVGLPNPLSSADEPERWLTFEQ